LREGEDYLVVTSDLQLLEAVRNSAQASATQPAAEIQISLLTGGQDKHYSFGLTKALVSKGVLVEMIGSDAVDSPELHTMPEVRFLNLRGGRRVDVSFVQKALRVFIYYVRLIRYALTARPKVFHILWNNKVEYFDRTVVTLFYKLCGKKIALTAHNVNQGRRDSRDSYLNRLTLKIQYRLVDHIFVHTEKMRDELRADFGVPDRSITVLIHPLNVAVPETTVTSAAAKAELGIREDERTILFFGAIAPYKGLDSLVTAFQRLVAKDARYRLIIAGRPKEGKCEEYWAGIQATIFRTIDPSRVIQDIKYVSDEKTELYFKAADVLALPYREIFQSGVLFLAYSYGLPVVAADVGSFRDTIVEGKTGFLCRPHDPDDLCKALEEYFVSELYKHLGEARERIREHARARHSWAPVAQLTRDLYAQLLRIDPL
jgi:glycosyltransferase involved in cell wall biosynthesis